MEVMAQIAMLFDAQSDKPKQNNLKEVTHRANEIAVMVEAGEVAQRLHGTSPKGAHLVQSTLIE